MPTYYEYKKEGIVHCFAVGNYSFEETYSNYSNALNDPRSSEGVSLIMDVRESDETRTSEEMNKIADLLAASSSFKGRCVVLVDPQSQVRYGLGRMLAILAEMRNLEFNVLFDENEAYDWLTT